MPTKSPPLGAHQERALDVMAENLTQLIEYGTGTGKTRIAVEAVQMFVQNGEIPILIMPPSSLIEQTYEQFVEWAGPTWTDKHVLALDSRYDLYKRRERLKRGKFPIYILGIEALSYNIIREGVTSRQWAVAMVDEASRFRRYSKRVVTLRAIGRRANSRYGFTGNLIVRDPSDCWYFTNWLRPGVWGTNDHKTFITKYFTLGGFTGVQPTGLRPEMRDEFFRIYNSMRIQAELRDVRELPPRELMVRRTNMGQEQARAYNQMRLELKVEIQQTSDSVFLSKAKTYASRLLRLQEIAAGFTRNTDGEIAYFPCPKTDEMIESILDDPETPTVIWYWFRPEAQIIKAALAKHGIDYVWFGDPGARQRFVKGEVPVFVSQIAKGGFGLNLTNAERMEYHSLPWDLDAYSQSQERNMRLNTPTPRNKKDGSPGFLEVVHNITRGTCEEYVRERLVNKANMSRQFSRSQALEMLK